jgi:hypothetical protein
MLETYVALFALLAPCFLIVAIGILAGVYLGKIKITVGKIIEIGDNKPSR